MKRQLDGSFITQQWTKARWSLTRGQNHRNKHPVYISCSQSPQLSPGEAGLTCRSIWPWHSLFMALSKASRRCTSMFLPKVCCCSVTQLCPTLCDPMDCSMPGCPSPSPGVCSNSCPLGWWCRPTISFSVVPFSSCLQSFPASRSFLMSWPFASGGQSIGVMISIMWNLKKRKKKLNLYKQCS